VPPLRPQLGRAGRPADEAADPLRALPHRAGRRPQLVRGGPSRPGSRVGPRSEHAAPARADQGDLRPDRSVALPRGPDPPAVSDVAADPREDGHRLSDPPPDGSRRNRATGEPRGLTAARLGVPQSERGACPSGPRRTSAATAGVIGKRVDLSPSLRRPTSRWPICHPGPCSDPTRPMDRSSSLRVVFTNRPCRTGKLPPLDRWSCVKSRRLRVVTGGQW